MLINKGKTEGLLTTEEISDALSDLELSKDQIENIFNIIDKLEIDIVDEKENDISTELRSRNKGKTLLKKKTGLYNKVSNYWPGKDVS